MGTSFSQADANFFAKLVYSAHPQNHFLSDEVIHLHGRINMIVLTLDFISLADSFVEVTHPE